MTKTDRALESSSTASRNTGTAIDERVLKTKSLRRRKGRTQQPKNRPIESVDDRDNHDAGCHIRVSMKHDDDATAISSSQVSSISCCSSNVLHPDNEYETLRQDLLNKVEVLLQTFLQLSDELEVLATFDRPCDKMAIASLQELLKYSGSLESIVVKIESTVDHRDHLELVEEGDLGKSVLSPLSIHRCRLLVGILLESVSWVHKHGEWNNKADTAFSTLLELFHREVDQTRKDIEVDGPLFKAWKTTGHVQELQIIHTTLKHDRRNDDADDCDSSLFRQVCYEVLVSTDQSWLWDRNHHQACMTICGIESTTEDTREDLNCRKASTETETPIYPAEAPLPKAAERVLETLQESCLPRTAIVTSILRRILPPEALITNATRNTTDTTVLDDNFLALRSTIRNPRGMAGTSLFRVAVTSVQEDPSSTSSLGLEGAGKTVMASLVASHPLVRRFFIDGIIWIDLGRDRDRSSPLQYSRYVAYLKEILKQLHKASVQSNEQKVLQPTFPDLIHIPGDSPDRKRRREEGFMFHARHQIADFVRGKKVLFILDDICQSGELYWFDFQKSSSVFSKKGCFALMLTTRLPDLFPAADTVEVGLLDEQEALCLLRKTSTPSALEHEGRNSQLRVDSKHEAHVMPPTDTDNLQLWEQQKANMERDLVRECAYHPFAVGTIRRWWLHILRQKLEHDKSDETSTSEPFPLQTVWKKVVESSNGDCEDRLFQFLNFTLSSVPSQLSIRTSKGKPGISTVTTCNHQQSDLLRICFSAIVVVFSEPSEKATVIREFPIIPRLLAELLIVSILRWLEGNTAESNTASASKRPTIVISTRIVGNGDSIEHVGQAKEEPDQIQTPQFHYRQLASGILDTLCSVGLLSSVESETYLKRASGCSASTQRTDSTMGMERKRDGKVPIKRRKRFLRLTHAIHKEYAYSILDSMENHRGKGERNSNSEVHTKYLEKKWNNLFARALLAATKPKKWGSKSNTKVKGAKVWQTPASIGYALQKLPSHEIRGGMYASAATLLGDRNFVSERMASMGVEKASIQQIEDTEQLVLKMPGIWKQKRKRRNAKKPLPCRRAMLKSYRAFEKQLVLLLMNRKDQDGIENARIDATPETVEISLINDDKRRLQFDVGRAHLAIGTSFEKFEQWKGAVANWEKSGALLSASLGEVEIVVAIKLNVGVIYARKLHDYVKALDVFMEALQSRIALHGEEHLLVAETLHKVGDVCLSMNNYDAAERSYTQALSILQGLTSLSRLDIGDMQEGIGTIHYIQGKVEEALEGFLAALQFKQAELGPRHPELGNVCHQIGRCLVDLEKHVEAIEYLGKAIVFKEMDVNGGPERDADVLIIRGIMNSITSGKPEERLDCYEKALLILVNKASHQKTKIAHLQDSIGCIYILLGRDGDAMMSLQASLEARRGMMDHDMEVANTLYNLAFLHQNQGRLDQALECMEEVLKIRELHAPVSEVVATTNDKIAKFARELGNASRAQAALQSSLTIQRSIHGEEHEEVAAVIQELADVIDEIL